MSTIPLLLFLLGLQASAAFIKLPNKFYHENTLQNTGSFDRALFSGRGLLTAVLTRYTDTVTLPLFVFHRVYVDHAIVWTETARLSPKGHVVSEMFLGEKRENEGGNTAMIKSTESGNIIMASSYKRSVDVYSNGAVTTMTGAGVVYVFAGEWSKWTQQQTITLDTNAKANDKFGIGVAMNRKYLGDAAIACGDCDPMGEFNIQHTGAVYSYTAQPPHYRIWTQQQILFERNYFFNRTGTLIDVNKNTLVAAASSTFYVFSASTKAYFLNQLMVYARPGPASRWTFAQKLDGVEYDVRAVSMRVWDDAIFIGNANGVLSYSGTAVPRFVDGHLKVYYPNLPAYKPRPSRKLEESMELEESVYVSDDKWTAPQWSLAQVLYIPGYNTKATWVAADQHSFGGYFDVFEDTMAIVTNRNKVANSAYMYVYEREYLGGQWSVQQRILTPSATTDPLYPPTVYHNTISYTQEAAALPHNIFSTDTVWDCLIVSMEDQFHDGWDTAKLRVVAPDGSDDLYYPSCDSTNSLKFRYCPLSEKDVGVYKFSIVGAEKAKFYWEIQWRVFEEKTGQWFMGRHDTQMDFEWNQIDKDFSHRAIVRDLPTNITCKECKPRPTNRPTSFPTYTPKGKAFGEERRALKSNTQHPTISPAPTLSQTDLVLEHWEWFVMKTSTPGLNWFDEQHKGTNYYISDIKAHRLVSTGTMCPWEGTEKQCWQTLPDGDYILRVSGDLNVDRSAHSWTFCGRAGSAREMMTFRVKDGKCDALQGYKSGSATSYCTRVLHTISVSSFIIELVGVHMADLSGDVNGAIAVAVQAIFPEAAEKDIRVDYMVDSEVGVELLITVGIDVGTLGFNAEDMESISNAHDSVEGTLKSALQGGAFLGALVSGNRRTGLEGVTATYFVEGHIVFNDDLPLENLASQESVKDLYTDPGYVDERTQQTGSVDGVVKHDLWLVEKFGIYSVSAVGYLVFAGVVAAVAVYTMRNPRAGVAAVKEVGEGMGEALVSYVADEEDMEFNSKGQRAVLPSVTKVPVLAARRIQKKVIGGVDRVGYSLVTTLDDIADGVVDLVLPPESSSGSESDNDK